jgi:hypothetical protein
MGTEKKMLWGREILGANFWPINEKKSRRGAARGDKQEAALMIVTKLRPKDISKSSASRTYFEIKRKMVRKSAND